jgi:hypothetical protein
VTIFEVRGRQVHVWKERGRWGVAVDGAVHRRWYRTEAQAAGAGLLRAQGEVWRDGRRSTARVTRPGG